MGRVLLFLLIPSFIFAQGHLTNAEVYDFQPQDVFQWKEYSQSLTNPSAPYPVTYYKDSVLIRTNYGNDSIVYQYEREVIYISPSSWQNYVTTSVVSETVRNLNSPVQHNNFTDTSCYSLEDTVHYDPYTGFNVWRMTPGTHPNPAGNCFEPAHKESAVHERVGGVEYSYVDYGSGLTVNRELKYFKLVTGETYGLKIVSVKESTQSKGAAVSLVNGTYRLNYTTPVNVQVVDLSGRVCGVFENVQGELDLSGLNTGMYYLRVKGDNGVEVKKLMNVK